MNVLALYNMKGGVGKTAAAVNLAYLAASNGARTLLWDLDPQGSASFYFRVRPKVKGGGRRLLRGKTDPLEVIRGTDFDGLDLLPADFSYRKADLALRKAQRPSRQLARLLQPLADEYDWIFLDCAPSISLLSRSIFVAADALVVPIIPTPLSLRTLDTLRTHLAKRGPKRLRVLPFLSMVDRRKSLHRRISDEPPDGAMDTEIPYATLVEQMGTRRAPLPSYAPASTAAQCFAALWQEIKGRLEA